MGPTLRGRHYEVACRHCEYRWPLDASTELDTATGRVRAEDRIAAARCPLCGLETELSAQAPQPGDRLFVDRWSYSVRPPRRWEAAVFRDPSRAGQPLIKRIVGLPGETIRIHGGEIWSRGPQDLDFQLARKPPELVRTLLTVVADSEHQGRAPSPWVETEHDGARQWTYRPGGLICDTAGYNAYRTTSSPVAQDAAGLHWVDDLALRLSVEVDGNSHSERSLSLELAPVGRRVRFVLEFSSGRLALHIDEGNSVRNYHARVVASRSAHDVTLAAVDGQAFVWIDDLLIDWGASANLDVEFDRQPSMQSFEPCRFGLRGEGVTIRRWQVLRDLYYTACQRGAGDHSDFVQVPPEVLTGGRDYLADPGRWPRVLGPDNLRSVEFQLGDEEYLMLGDNSPRSRDSRLWDAPAGVPRRLLIGRVAWP